MRIVIAAILAASSIVVSSAQQPAPAQREQKPTFQASTDLVVVDVTALDPQGKPIRDLTLEEFVVRVDGAPRRVSSAQFIDQAPKPMAKVARGALFTTNQSDDTGRLILLLVDQGTIQPGTLRAPAELLNRLFAGFGPSDKVGLATLPGPRMVVKPGGSRQQIIDALQRTPGSKGPRQTAYLKGSGAPGSTGAFRALYVGVTEAFRIDQGNDQALMNAVNRECAPDRIPAGSSFEESVKGCRGLVEMESRRIVSEARAETTQFVTAVRGILNGIKSIDAPKILIVLSQGLASPEAPREMVGLDRDAAAARTTIHALRLDRPMFDVENSRDDAYRFEDRDALRGGLEAMAGRAGGTIFEVTGSAAPAFDRLAAEMSGYYLVGLEPTAADRDGKAHKIDVSVQRPGVTVKNRPQFVFETPASPSAAKGDDKTLILNTLQSPVIDKRLPVRIVSYNMADDDPSHVRLLVSAEIDRQQEGSTAPLVGYLIYDESGKVVLDYYKRAELERLPSGGLRFVTIPVVPAGSYTLRLATVRNGRVGSVEHRFTAGLAGVGPLKLGDLVLTDGRDASAQLAPPVDAHMATDRVFGFVQIGAAANARPDASFVLELAKDDATAALVSAPLAAGNVRGGIQAVTGAVDVSLLPPGDYRARLVVSIAGKPVKTLFAPLLLDAVPRRGRPAANAGSAAGGGTDTVRPIADAVPFNVAEVLAPGVIAPFLDELVTRSRDLPAGAVEAAKAGRFDEAAAQMKGRTGDATAAFVRGAALLSRANAPSLAPAERRTTLQAASDAFRDTGAASPDSMVSAFYIAACYAMGGKDQQAANAWQTSLAGLDRYPVVYRLLADALGRLGQAERAVEVLDDASKQWPDDEVLRRRLAKAEIAAGLHAQALTQIESMIAKQPDDEALIFLAMQTLYELASNTPEAGLPALVARLEQFRGAYAAAKGSRLALVDEWISYLKRRT